MAVQGYGGHGEWHLGAEPIPLRAGAAIPIEKKPPDRSHERLDRPLAVVTVERLGWILVIAYAAATRLIMAGARPLDAAEASRSTAALDLGRRLFFARGHVPLADWLRDGWIGLLDASVIGTLGANDFTARLIFAIAGFALVALAFAMRSRIGRAGALAAAAVLTLSPNLTWYSRSAAVEMPAMLALFATVAMFLATVRRPRVGRAIVLGFVGGLTLASDPQMIVAAVIFAIALALIGGWIAVTAAHPWIDVQIWWRRRAAVVIVAAGGAIAIWLGCITALFTRPIPGVLAAALRPLMRPLGMPSPSVATAYLPAAYEFQLVLAGLAGLAIVAAWRIRSYLAAFVVIWTAGAIAAALLGVFEPPYGLAQIILPLALLAGFGLDWLHRGRGWILVRYPIAAVGILTIWVQLATNFVYPAPNPAEPHSARHATLFWIAPATTAGTPDRIAGIVGAMDHAPAAVYYAVDSPVARWYLRGLSSVASPADAGVIVGADVPPDSWSPAARVTLDLAERLAFAPDSLRPEKLAAALSRSILTARPDTPLVSESVEFLIRPHGPGARTEIIAPSPASSAKPDPTAK